MAVPSIKKLMESVAAVTGCPICLDQVSTPLVQCINGHVTCGSCRLSCTKCSVCLQPFIETPPRILEQVLQVLPKQCMNGGCTEMAIGDHKLFCKFRPMRCKVGRDDSCTWVGDVKDWHEHVKTKHELFTINYASGEEMLFYYTHFNSWKSTGILHFVDNNLFLINVSKINGVFHQSVEHVILTKPKSQFYFNIKFTYAENILSNSIVKAVNLFDTPPLSNSCMILLLTDLQDLVNEKGHIPVTFEVIEADVA